MFDLMSTCPWSMKLDCWQFLKPLEELVFFLDGAGKAAFFLVAVANGAGERELRTSRAGPCCRGWSGAEEVAEGDGLGGRAAAAIVDGAGERELPLSMAAVAEGRPPLLKL